MRVAMLVFGWLLVAACAAQAGETGTGRPVTSEQVADGPPPLPPIPPMLERQVEPTVVMRDPTPRVQYLINTLPVERIRTGMQKAIAAGELSVDYCPDIGGAAMFKIAGAAEMREATGRQDVVDGGEYPLICFDTMHVVDMDTPEEARMLQLVLVHMYVLYQQYRASVSEEERTTFLTKSATTTYTPQQCAYVFQHLRDAYHVECGQAAEWGMSSAVQGMCAVNANTAMFEHMLSVALEKSVLWARNPECQGVWRAERIQGTE